jgi:hypothetical protein
MPVTTFAIPMTMGEKSAVRALKPSTLIPIYLDVQPRSSLLCTRHTPQGFVQRLPSRTLCPAAGLHTAEHYGCFVSAAIETVSPCEIVGSAYSHSRAIWSPVCQVDDPNGWFV